MKYTFRYLKFYKKECVLAPLFKMLEAVLELFVPLIMAKIIDDGIGNSDKPFIVKMSLLLVGIGIVGLVVAVLAQFFAAKAAVGASSKMRKDLFAHIHTLSFSDIDRIGTSTLITRTTNDITQVQNGINMTLRLLLRSPFVVFGAMIMAFAVDAHMATVFLVAIPILSLIVGVIMYVTIPMYRRVQSHVDRLLYRTRENLDGVRVIRAFGSEAQETEKFRRENSTLTNMQKRVGLISALTNPLTYVVVNLAIVWIVWQGGIRINSGRLTQGQLIALYNYMTQILVELIKLANLIITVTKSVACADRIETVFLTEGKIKDGKTDSIDYDSDSFVEFRDVTLRYGDAGAPALSDVSFTVRRGETLGIIGGTGSGKSSVINMIPRFYEAESGEVLLFGKNVKDYDVKTLRDAIGVVPQKAVLFRGSIRDNIKMGNEAASDAEIERAMEIAQADDILRDKGLDYMIEEGGKNLSGGQKQRLTIARAIVRDPKILILDDSASALDFATDARLRRAIRKISDTKTVIIASQRTSAVSAADKILVMSDGRIADEGTHGELLTSSEIYREIYDSQFGEEEK